MECWAHSLGNCGGGRSREHYISDGIFDGATVTAFGLPWCKDEPVTIGLASATSKILCKRHNEALSSFDAEAAKLSRFISSNIVHEPLAHTDITLQGPLIEKWALKTFLNLGFIGALDRGVSRLTPPSNLVKSLFASDKLRNGLGLYFITGGVSNDGFKVGLAWNAIVNRKTGRPDGMTFTFNGLRLAVTAISLRAEAQIRGLGRLKGFDYSAAKVLYHPPNIIMASETAGNKRINLEW
jgi:hypothetical protein